MDYAKRVYSYPLAVHCLGAIYHHRDYVCKRFRLDELFSNGMDVEYLFADRVREGNNLATALLNVFGYD